MNPKAREALVGAALAVKSVDWQESFALEDGACIPIAVFGAAYLSHAGIQAQVMEAGARFIDPFSPRYAEMRCIEEGLKARDEVGLEFLGHCVIHLPTHRLAVDLSLPTQGTATLHNLGTPDVLVGPVDHTQGRMSFRVVVGRGSALYRLYPKRDGWKKRDWPYEMLREMAVEARLARGLFAFLKDHG